MFARAFPILFVALSFMSSARAATIFTTQLPASGEASSNSRSVELGVRFRSDAAGEITGLRFYKIAGNTGAHTGHLWANTGALLGSLTFTGETETGWQTATFAAPIAIQAGTTYVASYHTAAFYAVTRLTFAAAGIDNPPLHALRDGVDGFNGTYAYSSAAVFPDRGTRSSNYWVDVLFSAAGPDGTPPTVTLSSPAAGAAVRGTVAVAAAAADNVAVTTVQFKLDGAALGPPDLSPPYAASWDTVLSSGGAHSLSAVAWDEAGNASTSAAVSVTVDNTPPVISSVAVTDLGQSSATVAWTTNEPATAQVEYGATIAYGSVSALDASTVTGHSRVLSGLSAGTLYHYRVTSADAAGNLAVSGDGIFTTTTTPPVPACLTSAGAWRNFSFPVMTSSFTANFDATPHAANMDGVMGLSNGAASAYTQLADIVRFNTAGFIDARNGGVYAAAAPLPYSPGTSYRFHLEVNIASHTYTAYVSSPGASPQLVGSDFAFRTEQSAVNSLDNMGFIASIGSETVCGLTVSSDTVAPAVAVSSPAEGALVRGTIAVSASAADNMAVAGVQFKLDGADLDAPDAAAPYGASWNTALSADGPHDLSAVAWDAEGNASTAAAVSVVVDNTPPLLSSIAVAGIGRSSATVAWFTDEPATAQVEFGTSAAYGSSTALDLSTVTGHAGVLHELAAGTLYHYRVRSADAAGNSVVSADGTFATAVFIGTIPPTVVSLTFDDGTASQVLARDILDQRGVKGTFYVNSGRIGVVPAYMTLAELQSIAAGGHEIGGHTVDHLNVTTLTTEQLQHQICDDRAALVSLGFNAVSLAYPFGAYNAAAESVAAGCGYRSARGVGGLGCTGCPRSVPIPPPDAFAVATPNSVRKATTLAEMQRMVVDGEEASGGWVPIVMHLICDGCDTYAVSSGTLGAFLDWLQPRAAAGTVIKTMGEAMAVDLSPPTVAISSPAAGSVVAGTAATAATAFDDVAVATVQFRLDGADLGPPDAAAPYALAWDTTASSDGPHNLSAVAWDTAGNASTAAVVTVVVDNTAPVISSVTVTDVGISSAAIAWNTDEPATARVEYGTTTAYGSVSALDPSTATSRSRVLIGLSTGTAYHYRVRSADAVGNLAVSGDYTFSTVPDLAPTVAVSSPAAGLVVAGTAAVAATAFDDVAVATVQFRLDGIDLGPPDAAEPYGVVWETTASSDGPHNLSAVAWDTAGNASTSAVVAVTVDNTAPVISSVTVMDVGISSAAIAWNTDEPATARVEYGTTTSYGSVSALDPSTATSRSRLLIGLSTGTAYHYRVRSADAVGNLAVSGDFTFSTLAVPDVTPPTVAVSSPAAGSVVAGTAAVAATAFDDVAVATVQFRLDGADLGPPDAAAPYAFAWDTTASSDGPHNLSAVAWDTAGNASTSPVVAVTVDNTPPAISSVAVTDLGQSSATVAWLTGEAATSQVEYGTTTAYGSVSALDPSTVTAHARILSGLAAGATYHFRARSADAVGNLAVSGDYIFSTVPDLAPTVAVSSPAAGSVLAGTAAVAATAFDDVAVATVQFRLDGADLGPPDAAAPYAFAWDTTASSDGPHNLSAVAWDAAGNASTSAVVAVTVDNTPPVISSVTVTDVGISSAAIAWNTDEPATARVEYGTTTAYGSVSALDPSTATSRSRLLIGLSTGTAYHYRVRSADAIGNLALSGDFTFSTLAVPDVTPPTVAVSSPGPDAVIGGTVAVAATAFDDVAVETVQFRLDGADLGPPDAAAPYALAWDTTASSDGPHNLSAVAWDAAGNASTAAVVTVVVDNAPPVISSVVVLDLGQSSAAIAWNTDEPATARVEYGTTTAYGSLTALDPSTATAHARILSGLAAGATYHFRARSADAVGNLAVSDDYIFSTVPDLAPTVAISSPAAGSVVAGTAAVAATAFDDVAVATVQFRLDGADLGPPDAAAPYALAWDTTASSDGPHNLSAVAWDTAGNASTSAVVAVIVDNAPPVISSVAVTDVGISSAAIAWNTDEPATARVEYGTTTAYGSVSALDLSTVTAHARILSGLAAGTLYHYRAASADAVGNLALSDDRTFITAPAGFGCQTSAGDWRNAPIPPQISSFTVSFAVTPSSVGMNASIGLSSGAAGSLAGLAAAVRFNPQGFIDVRYSTSYARMTPVAYSTGTSYRFDLRVNASAHIFDAYVTPAGGPRTMLARNYTFHSNQSTATVLANLGLFASSGAATMCNLTVAASTVPWWDGVRELYATAAGSKTWYSTWDNGIDRAFGRAKDPTDPWFDAAHGTASYLIDAASGVFKISGTTPRMYIHHPEFVTGSSSLTVANAHAKQWRDVEMTVYGMRVADSNVSWAGIDGIARSNHGMTGDETVHLCDSRGIGARFRNNGRLDFEKEIHHPTSYAVNTTTTALWPSGTAMPFNVWIGFKYAVYDLPNGNVKVESYMDMTNGVDGGSWILVNQFEDNGANWGGGTGCAAGVNPQERLTNSSSRPGSESGLPNVTVYFRSDGVGTNGLLYKKMSIREIVAPSAGPGPLAAAGAAEPGGAAPAAAADAFLFRDLYAFPNPSRRGERVTIRLQAGVADGVEVALFDLSGRRVGGGAAEGPAFLDDGNGKGPQFTYDYHWDVRGAASAVYVYAVIARKRGQAAIGRTGRVALIK